MCQQRSRDAAPGEGRATQPSVGLPLYYKLKIEKEGNASNITKQ
jgi:hypothetical protein